MDDFTRLELVKQPRTTPLEGFAYEDFRVVLFLHPCTHFLSFLLYFTETLNWYTGIVKPSVSLHTLSLHLCSHIDRAWSMPSLHLRLFSVFDSPAFLPVGRAQPTSRPGSLCRSTLCTGRSLSSFSSDSSLFSLFRHVLVLCNLTNLWGRLWKCILEKNKLFVWLTYLKYIQCKANL